MAAARPIPVTPECDRCAAGDSDGHRPSRHIASNGATSPHRSAVVTPPSTPPTAPARVNSADRSHDLARGEGTPDSASASRSPAPATPVHHSRPIQRRSTAEPNICHAVARTPRPEAEDSTNPNPPWSPRQCSICLESLDGGSDTFTTPCSHVFHVACLST